MKEINVYTDGACSGNPGPGGWAAILIYGEHEKVISGAEKMTTNNRMEVIAAIEGLSALKERAKVTLYSDSAYLVNAIECGWLDKWKTRKWKNSEGETVKNRELWEKIDALMNFHDITFVKVKGHADNVYNNRCDKEARNAIKALLFEDGD